MKIRSITAFLPSTPTLEESLAQGGEFLARARQAYEQAGFEVQTVRAATPPLRRVLDPHRSPGPWAEGLERLTVDAGIDYLSVGPLLSGESAEAETTIREVIDATEKVFATMALTGGSRLDLEMARAAARCIVALAPLRENGFGNLRFAALANVGPGVPFLPAAYHDGGPPQFALALETANLARASFGAEGPLDERAHELSAAIEEAARRLESIADDLAEGGALTYRGADFSLAPFPRDEDSVGGAMESMGIEAAGRPGTALAAALLTGSIDRARFRRAGFNGLFLPVLEDERLARRAAEGTLRLEDLLLASTVCGTGLDTVPLPGDVTAEELVPYLLDLGSLALRLEKPLTARLMPMPGRAAGDELTFDFPFFASGRVMDLRRSALGGRLADESSIEVTPRHMRKMP